MNSKTTLLDPNQSHEITIEKLSFGGFGIGRINNVVVFVPYSAPGDQLLIQITQTKDKYCFAQIQKILKPSPHRVDPLCPVFGVCGGCSLQHIDYGEQIRQKQNIVQEELDKSLKKAGDFAFKVKEIVPSPQSFRYRNRIQIKFQNPKIGFYSKKTNTVVDIDDCPITEKLLAEQIPVVKKQLIQEKKLEVDKIELFLDQKNNEPKWQIEKSASHNKSDKNEAESDSAALGFSQVNSFQNKNLQDQVIQILQKNSPEVVYDFYAGAGNFSFDILKKIPKTSLVSVELNAKSVEWAQNYIRQNNLSPKNIRFFMSDVESFLKRNILKEDSVVILDPPRVGCSDEVIRLLSVQSFKKLIYISCNPTTLGRDLQRFLLQSKQKWKISQVLPLDMFPQTSHVEVLAELDIDS